MDPIAKEERYVLPTYAKLPFLLVRGEGNRVFDSDGREFLDLYGGHAVCVIGHSHPRLVAAISQQARELTFYSNVCYHPMRAEAAERLVTRSYDNMAQVYFCNSGTEANETALKIARRSTGRRRVISMVDGFHGRTIGALSVTGRSQMRSDFRVNLDEFTDFVPFGRPEVLAEVETDDVAALILEPIQSLAGVQVAPPEYYVELRRFCDERGIVLIFDEVQTAPGRTGSWFAGQRWGVQPDLVTCAKGIGGGFPVGAVIASDGIAAEVHVGDHGSTFGGGPLAVAAVATTFDVLEEEGAVARTRELSEQVFDRLRALAANGFVRDVRGLGYLIGIECSEPARDVTRRLREGGILVGSSYQPNTIRLLPPLTVTASEWDRFFDRFERIARQGS